MAKSLAWIVLSRKRTLPLQAQLAAKVRSLIHEGGLKPGEPVPPSRQLAADLHISRNTVTYVYDRLVDEGYIESRPRSGLFVCEAISSVASPSRRERVVTERTPQPDRISFPRPFQGSRPDVRLFPLAVWNRARGRALKKHQASLLRYQSELPLGLPALRRAIGTYLRDHRGVNCDWQQIAITSGSQHALYLLAHVLVRPGASC